MAESRFNRYRQLSIQLGEQRARALLDRLQVLALTEPDTLREFEAFIDRQLSSGKRLAVNGEPHCRPLPDRRQADETPEHERRQSTTDVPPLT
jgi:hypothetical protein